MSEVAAIDSSVDGEFWAGALGQEAPVESEATSTWLYNQREVSILSLQRQAKTVSDPAEKLKLISQVFAFQCAQVQGEQAEKTKAGFETLRSLSLPEARMYCQRESDPKVRAIFESYVEVCELTRSIFNIVLDQATFSRLNLYQKEIEMSQLSNLFKEETHPHKLFVLQKQLFVRQLESLSPEMRAQLPAIFQALENAEGKDLRKVDCPKEVKATLQSYSNLIIAARQATHFDTYQLLQTINAEGAVPPPHLYILETYQIEKQLDCPIVGNKLLCLEFNECLSLLSFVNALSFLSKVNKDPVFVELESLYAKPLTSHLQHRFSQLDALKDEMDPGILSEFNIVQEAMKDENNHSVYSKDGYKYLLLALHQRGKLPNEELLFQVKDVTFGRNPSADKALEFVKIACQVAGNIATSSPADAKHLLEDVKTLVDETIYSNWYSCGNTWTLTQAKALLEIGKVYHLQGWEKPEALMTEIDRVVESTRFDKFDIRKEYGYSYNDGWFYFLKK